MAGARRAFGALDDVVGWAASKIGGLLVVAWLAWLVAMLGPVPYTRATLALTSAAVGAARWLWPDCHTGPRSAIACLQQRRVAVLAVQLALAASFGFFVLLRSYDPTIGGTQKPMDMAFMNGFVSADRLPTQDTWLAGYGVPYYYFGYFLFASLAKLSGVPAAVAYNLAAATVPALAVLVLGALASSVVRATRCAVGWAVLGGILAPALVLLGGNLRPPLELLVSWGVLQPTMGPALGIKGFADSVVRGSWPPDGGWWFAASRVVPNIQPDGINEFPFFSAFLSDLHPHFMALPVEALVLTLAAAHYLSGGATLRSRWAQGASALAVGALLPLNTWDVASFGPLYVLGAWQGGRALPWRRRLVAALAGPIAGLVLFLPYLVGYSAPPLGLGLVADRTPLGSLLVLFGGQLLILASFGLWVRWRVRDGRGWLLVGAGAVAGGGLAGLGEPTLGLLVALGALLVPWPGLLARTVDAEALIFGLAGFAVALLLGVELFFLRDTFGTRMNTVFKFHFNAWLLLGFAAAAVTVMMARNVGRMRLLALSVAAVVVGAELVYPIAATQLRLATQPAAGLTLDGSRFLTSDEEAAVSWLHHHQASGRAVILEAVAGDYTSGARMATYSGSATVIGWPGHELQWRGPLAELGTRQAEVEQVYRGTDPEQTRQILQHYGVDCVVVGDLERETYGPAVDALDSVLPPAFRAGRVTIFRVGA